MAKLRCAILDDYQKVALSSADWSLLTPRVDVIAFDRHFEREEDLVDALKDCEIVVLMRERTPFTASVFRALPNLRLVVTSGMANAAIDHSAAGEVLVCGTGGTLAAAVEMTWALILGVARHLVAEAGSLKAGGPWQSTVGMDLRGATLGIIGLGNVGRQVAIIGSAFGMKVQAWSPNLTAARAGDAGVALAESKNALLASSDVVTIHMKLGPTTRGLIGADDLAAMRPSAILINTARGPLVDEAALIDALERRAIAGAGIDVFDIEPLPLDHPMRGLPNLLATPHLGYVSGRNYARYFKDAVEDIQAFLDGAPLRKLSPDR